MAAPQADVVIIGSGAGGSACAWALCRQGIQVLILEAGPAFDPYHDYRLHRGDWERSGFPRKAGSRGNYSFAPLQPLDERWEGLRSWNRHSGLLNPGETRLGAHYHHVRGTGGSTLHFTGEAHRLHPEAMRMHSRFGVAADWPLTYAELDPWYAQAEQVVGVAATPTTSRPRSGPYPLPAHQPGYASQRIMEGSRELGLHWEPNPVAVLPEAYDGRPGCNYCSNCNRGCPRKDKGSADVTFLAKALASGCCEILTRCEVTGIEAGNDDRVSRVHYVDADGNGQALETRVLVLAAGAVQTPRLLLLSAGPQAPDGLANESGQVGHHFMETHFWSSAALHPEPLGSYRGLPSDIICWDFNAPDAIPEAPGGCRFSPSTAESDLLGPIAYATRMIGGWGQAHKRAMRERFGHALAIGAIGESPPNAGTFIDLDPEQRDGHGLPLPRIHSRVEDADLARLRFMADWCRKILAAAGAGELVEEHGSSDFFNATHVFGTARMGRNPRDSVVNSHGRSHRWKNLYIADASVFPSSGGGESPSLTIEALAMRTGAEIHRAMLGDEV